MTQVSFYFVRIFIETRHVCNNVWRMTNVYNIICNQTKVHQVDVFHGAELRKSLYSLLTRKLRLGATPPDILWHLIFLVSSIWLSLFKSSAVTGP
jgi:hypothetical protein